MTASLAKEWTRKAEEDFEAARSLSRKKRKATPDVVCFLAQQSAEKYLKAFLASHKERFSKTHDLMELLTLCSTIDSSFELVHDLLSRLNPYAVEFRYPGEEASKHESRLAMEAIAEVRSFLRQKISSSAI